MVEVRVPGEVNDTRVPQLEQAPRRFIPDALVVGANVIQVEPGLQITREQNHHDPVGAQLSEGPVDVGTRRGGQHQTR
jgi:hypothetical protein